MPVEIAFWNQDPVIGWTIGAYKSFGLFHVCCLNESNLGYGLAIFRVVVNIIEIDSEIGFHFEPPFKCFVE